METGCSWDFMSQWLDLMFKIMRTFLYHKNGAMVTLMQLGSSSNGWMTAAQIFGKLAQRLSPKCSATCSFPIATAAPLLCVSHPSLSRPCLSSSIASTPLATGLSSSHPSGVWLAGFRLMVCQCNYPNIPCPQLHPLSSLQICWRHHWRGVAGICTEKLTQIFNDLWIRTCCVILA